MAELADALDLGSSPLPGGGSNPPPRIANAECEMRNAEMEPRIDANEREFGEDGNASARK